MKWRKHERHGFWETTNGHWTIALRYWPSAVYALVAFPVRVEGEVQHIADLSTLIAAKQLAALIEEHQPDAWGAKE